MEDRANRLLSSHEVIDYDGKNWPEEDEQTVVLVSYAMAAKVPRRLTDMEFNQRLSFLRMPLHQIPEGTAH